MNVQSINKIIGLRECAVRRHFKSVGRRKLIHDASFESIATTMVIPRRNANAAVTGAIFKHHFSHRAMRCIKIVYHPQKPKMALAKLTRFGGS